MQGKFAGFDAKYLKRFQIPSRLTVRKLLHLFLPLHVFVSYLFYGGFARRSNEMFAGTDQIFGV